MDLSICERWLVPAPAVRAGRAPWFYDWARTRTAEVSAHLTAGYCAYRSLGLVYEPGEIVTAREYFGGLGAQSLMIQERFTPEEHTVLDLSPDAVHHLSDLLLTYFRHRPVRVHQADSYDPGTYRPADLVGLDFGDLTAWRLRPGEAQRTLLDRVIAGKPKAVVLTDVAGPRLHLHRERYSQVLHTQPERIRSYAAYLEGLTDWMRAHYGYHPVRGYYHRWSAVIAFVPEPRATDSGLLQPVPDRPVGLEFT